MCTKGETGRMKLENDFLCVEIADLGAEVTRIYDKEKETEVLWEGNPLFWKRHSPVLFPNVGKTYQNILRIGDVTYPTSQHGFARDTEFSCVKSSADRASYMMLASEETKEVYPYEFELHINYQLKGKHLHVEWLVKNRSEETIYFTIGGHPAFRFAEPGEKKEDYCLKFPGKEALKYLLLDPSTGTARPENCMTLKLENEVYPLYEDLFANDALIFDDGQIEEVWLCKKDGTPYVGMHCEGFPNYGIWSVKDAPFVCLEPWAGRCDNYGFEGDISEKPGINRLDGGESFRKGYTIIVA